MFLTATSTSRKGEDSGIDRGLCSLWIDTCQGLTVAKVRWHVDRDEVVFSRPTILSRAWAGGCEELAWADDRYGMVGRY